MKAIHTYIGICALTLSLASCTYNKLQEPENSSQSQLVPENLTTIAQLKALYKGTPLTIKDKVSVLATVASDDTEGNLYKTFYVQDETGGIELKLGMGNLSTLYPQGSKVVVQCQGMTLGQYAGQTNLGYASTNERYETAYYPELMVTRQALEYIGKGELTPRKLTMSTLSAEYNGTLIELDGVEFVSSDLGKTYADPENKQTTANVNRTLTDKSGNTLIVRTSSYAKFAGKKLPDGSGKITALLTYFRTTPQLLLLRERDIVFDNPRF